MKFNYNSLLDSIDSNEYYWLVAPKERRLTTDDAMKSYRKFDCNISSNAIFLKHFFFRLPYFVFLPVALLLMTRVLLKRRLIPRYLAIFSTTIDILYLTYSTLILIFFSLSEAVTIMKITLFFLSLLFVNFIFLANFIVKFSYFRFDMCKYDISLSFVLCVFLSLNVFIFISLINFVISNSESIRHVVATDMCPFVLLLFSNILVSFFIHYKI